MKYLLDTNIVVIATLALSGKLRDRFAACNEDDLVTSTIVFAEAAFGSIRNKPPPIEILRAFVRKVPMLDFGPADADAYSRLPFRRGRFDHLIAAQAVSRGLTVITTNVGDFSDIPGLVVEDWTK